MKFSDITRKKMICNLFLSFHMGVMDEGVEDLCYETYRMLQKKELEEDIKR